MNQSKLENELMKRQNQLPKQSKKIDEFEHLLSKSKESAHRTSEIVRFELRRLQRLMKRKEI
jgi:hypothetical protein